MGNFSAHVNMSKEHKRLTRKTMFLYRLDDTQYVRDHHPPADLHRSIGRPNLSESKVSPALLSHFSSNMYS